MYRWECVVRYPGMYRWVCTGGYGTRVCTGGNVCRWVRVRGDIAEGESSQF